MSIELTEAVVHNLKQGDMIVVQSTKFLKMEAYLKTQEFLEVLRQRIKRMTGKDIIFVLLENSLIFTQYRAVKEKEVGKIDSQNNIPSQ